MMTDLEICKRIAEIEGVTLSGFHPTTMSDGSFYTRASNGAEVNINYLTDKALCFDLMVKYEVVFLDGEAFAGCESGAAVSGGGYYCNGIAEDNDPQRAICLAIIDAHKEQ